MQSSFEAQKILTREYQTYEQIKKERWWNYISLEYFYLFIQLSKIVLLLTDPGLPKPTKLTQWSQSATNTNNKINHITTNWKLI